MWLTSVLPKEDKAPTCLGHVFPPKAGIERCKKRKGIERRRPLIAFTSQSIRHDEDRMVIVWSMCRVSI